ncbi:Crp/Fnr family transcriptional regulator [Granulosicoccaceae sp. 1_MG-2023]|nr:Crp/Fnr family transcriptional regulator [Granulosicoccaceae sp. 1_MG-2023]
MTLSPTVSSALPESLLASLQANSRSVALPQGIHAFEAGQPCKAFLLVTHGSVKVVQHADDGREIVLYRVQDGESCLLTTACLLSGEDYAVSAITECETRALALPADTFNTLLDTDKDFRHYVFRHYSARMSDFIRLVRELAFGNLDRRLRHCLLERAGNTGHISMTHQALADELGSTREVVSRRLKEYENLGWIRLHRGEIELLDTQGLGHTH